MINSIADIVIVDDKRANLHLLSNLLSDVGYYVRPIPDGKQALRAVRKRIPDLILLDVMMPDIDGYEVCKRLKSSRATRDIPVIFISALNDSFDKVKAFHIGGVDYITKPFQKEVVIARIENQLTIQRQKLLLASVLNSSLDGIIALQAVRDQENKIVDFQFLVINPAASEILEQPLDDLIGKNLLENFPGLVEEDVFKECVSIIENDIVLHREVYYNNETIRGWFQIVIVKLGDGVAVTFRNITNRKKMELALRRQANLDGLTEVANRRRFDEYMEEEWQHCMTKQQPLSLVFCDVDYFKLYNDRYGHQMGDQCLIQVVRAIQGAGNRSEDLTARYGGEEFAIVLPRTPFKSAMQMAELIRKAILRLQIAHESSQINQYVTISLGVSSIIPHKQSSPQNLIAAADKALYRAKHEGRNCITGTSMPSP